MAIVQTVNFSSFCDAFVQSGRADSFSYEAKQSLFAYLEDYSEHVELDVISLCSEYSEANASEIIESFMYGQIEPQYDFEDEEDFKERQQEAAREYLEENTTIIMEEDGTFLYANF